MKKKPLKNQTTILWFYHQGLLKCRAQRKEIERDIFILTYPYSFIY